jgi:MFS family permease
VRGFITFAFFGTDVYVTLTLTDVHRASTALAGERDTGGTITWTTGAWVQERLVNRIGPRVLVRTGALLVALGIVGMIVVARAEVPVATAVVAWAIAGLGMGLSYSPISLVVLGEAPTGGEGMATASLQLCDTLGVALGTGVGGAIVAAGDALGWSTGSALSLAFVVCTVFALAVVSASVRLPRLPAAAVGAAH